MAVPTGAGPFLNSFESMSTAQIVTVVTGPVAGFDGAGATYSLQCIPGAGNTLSQGMAQAWFQILP